MSVDVRLYPHHVIWQEGTMIRERALKVVLVLVGLLFSAGIYPLIGSLLHPADSDTGDTMMLSLYVALGIFLLIAVWNPSAHRSLIAFAAWSSFAHAVAMSILGLEIPSQRVGFLIGSTVLVVIGVALIVLAPAKHPVARASAVGA
jgi:tryptophan-rich sensory protein